MSKKKKIVIGSITAAIFFVAIALSLTLGLIFASKGPFFGSVSDADSGAPVAGVMVTDGRNVVKTDENGKFELKGYHKSRFVTVTVPSGYNAEKFYIPVDKSLETYDFKLEKLNVDYSAGHSFLQISDTEINSKSDVEPWLNHVKGLIAEHNPAFLIHTGDICYIEGLQRHIKVMNSENMNLPVRYVIGNHDYVKWGKYGEALYESLYGPVWYSFDVANVHYVVTPFQVGADVASGYDKNDRWKWLENDLKNVSPSMKVVMFNHTTPPANDYVVSYGSKKLDLKSRNLIAWVFGHYHDNYVEMNDGILNVSTSRPDCGGIDSSVSGSRLITVGSDGKVSTQMFYYDFVAPSGVPAEAVWTSEQLEGNVLFCDTLLVDGVVLVATSDDDYPRECGVYAVNASDGRTLWFYPTANSVKNNLVCVGNKIIAQDAGGTVYCVNKDDGVEIWRNSDVNLGASLDTSSGMVSDGEKVFVGAPAGVAALGISDGIEVWSIKSSTGEPSPAEFVVVGDKLLINSHWDALIAVDKNTGRELWKNRDENLRFRSSTPAVADENTLLVADDAAIMTINIDSGKIIEKKFFKDENNRDVYAFNTSSQPYIKQGIAYIATANKGVIAYDLVEKRVVWNFVTGKSLVYTAPYSSGESATVESSFVEKDGCLIFGANDGHLYKIKMSDGSLVANVDIGAPIFGKAALDNDGVIVSDFSGRILKVAI